MNVFIIKISMINKIQGEIISNDEISIPIQPRIEGNAPVISIPPLHYFEAVVDSHVSKLLIVFFDSRWSSPVRG